MMMIDGKDEHGVTGHLGSDTVAFENFYRGHVEDLIGFFARRSADPTATADLVADTFLAVIENAHRFDPQRGEARAGLFGTARHTLSLARRRRDREVRATERLSALRLLEPDDYARLDARVVAESQRRVLWEALDRLPEPQRAVLELVGLDGLTPTQAAVALAINPATARMRLSRGRRRAAALLQARQVVPLDDGSHALGFPTVEA